MDISIEAFNNAHEPEWLENLVIGDLRVWQIIFLALAGVTTIKPVPIDRIIFDGMLVIVVMVCCCFRFRIPRTKQQIEADYQRRKITTKFRHELETIQDVEIDAMSLKDAIDLLHEKTTHTQMESENQPGSQPSSIVSPQQSSLEAFQPEGGQKPEPQTSGMSFVKFASKVANMSKLGQPKSPTSPTPSSVNKMDF